MDNLSNLLSKKNFSEPEEYQIIKDFIKQQYSSEANVVSSMTQILITVPNAALAGTLRLDLAQLQKACNTNKRMVIHIGNISS